MNDLKKKESNNKPYKQGAFIGAGLALGTACGVLSHNTVIGICLGLIIGAGLDSAMMNRNKKQ